MDHGEMILCMARYVLSIGNLIFCTSDREFNFHVHATIASVACVLKCFSPRNHKTPQTP